MYACVYVCMYVLCMCYVCMYACMYVLCMYYVCMYACMYVYVCVYVCTYVCVCVCVCMYVGGHEKKYNRKQVYTFGNTYIHTYMEVKVFCIMGP